MFVKIFVIHNHLYVFCLQYRRVRTNPPVTGPNREKQAKEKLLKMAKLINNIFKFYIQALIAKYAGSPVKTI